MRDRIDLGTIQETLLIPLYARAQFTLAGSTLINDPKAVEIVEAIDYDFSVFDGKPSLLGCVVRTRILDHWVSRWMASHPGGTVVEIGAGLNTRFERLDDDVTHWLELDLPDAMSLRQRFFVDSGRRTLFAGSVTEAAFLDIARTMPGPWCVVAEAVLWYVPESAIRSALARITDTLPGANVIFDTWGRWLFEHQDENDLLSDLDARVAWGVDDPGDIESWDVGLALAERCTLADPPQEVAELFPPEVSAMVPVLREEPQVRDYMLNRFVSTST
jgi:O-methyltransferase involved in polyketide biosynthesis